MHSKRLQDWQNACLGIISNGKHRLGALFQVSGTHYLYVDGTVRSLGLLAPCKVLMPIYLRHALW